MTPEDKRAAIRMRQADRYGKRMTLQAIGDVFHVTRERIRQIVGPSGRRTSQKDLKKVKWSIAKSIYRDQAMTKADIAAQYGLAITTVSSVVPSERAYNLKTGEQRCCECKQVKPFSEFYPVGEHCWSTRCKECNNIACRRWRDKNRKHLRQYLKKYRRGNEQYLAYQRQWHKENYRKKRGA